MKTLALSAVTVFILAVQPTAQAQPGATYGYFGHHYPHPYYGQHLPHHGYPRYRASTVAEGYLRGLSSVIRAQGQYNRMTAEAWIAAEQAREHAIQNREMAADTYFAMREANRQARVAEQRPRVTAEQAARLAASTRPDLLRPDELHPQTGRIFWPVLLRAGDYAPHRSQLEYLFARRAAHGRLAADDLTEVDHISEAMRDILRGQIREVSQPEYMAARKFIERLAHTARQPLTGGPGGLAMAGPSR